MDPKKAPQRPTILAKDNAIRLLEECCAESVLDEDFAIGPQFGFREEKEGFICFLTLPLPGPFRDIPSDPLPTKDAAKESVAFMACSMLVELGRLHNVVVPIEIPDDDSDDEDDHEGRHHDFIVIDSDDDDTPDTIDISGKFTDGYEYPRAHPIRSLHPSLCESRSFHLYAVSRTSNWKKGSRDTCILTSKDILPGDGSRAVTLLDHAREVKVFPQQLVLTRSQHQLLGRFTQFVLKKIWMWDPNKIAKVDYLFAPVDLTTDPVIEKVINWNDMKIQDTLEMQDFRKHLDRIGYLDAVTFVPSVMESLVATSKSRISKAANLEAISAKLHPAKRIQSDNLDKCHRISLGSQFQKCLKATHLYVDNPYWNAHDLTVGMNSRTSEFSNLESLGTALVEGGLDRAIMAYRTLHPEYATFSRWSDLGKNHALSLSQYGESKGVHPAAITQFPGRERLESAFGYSFKDPLLFWHARHDGRRFQRLEFLGDAVLDYVLYEHYHRMFPRTRPGAIMELKTECVRNRTLSALALSWGLHADILRAPCYHAAADMAILDIRRMEALSPTKTLDGKYWLKLSLPKVFADQTEAFIGGIYADSGFNMEVMFDVVRRMVGPFMDRYVLPSVVDMFERSARLNGMPKPTMSMLQSTNLPYPKPLPAVSILMPTEPIATDSVASLLAPKKSGIMKKTHSPVQAPVIRTTDMSGRKMKSAASSKSRLDAKGLVVSFDKRPRRRKSKNRRLMREAIGPAGVGLANMSHSSQGAGSAMTSGCSSAGIFIPTDEKEDNAYRTKEWCLSQAYVRGFATRLESASQPAFASGPIVGPQQPSPVSAFKSFAPIKYIPTPGAATGPESSMVASGPTFGPPSDVFSKSFLWAGSQLSSPLSLLATATTDFSTWQPSITPAPAGWRRSSFTTPPHWTDSSYSSPSKAERATFTPGQVCSMGRGQRSVPAVDNPVYIPWRPLFETKSAIGPGPGSYRASGRVASVGAFGSSLPTTEMFGTVKSCPMDSGSTPGVGPDKCGSTGMASGFGSGLASPASFGFSIPFSYGMPSKPITTNPEPEKVAHLAIQNKQLDNDEDIVMLE